MPCVFPVLFLKGLALVNSGNEERAKLRMHGMVYAAGILVSFWALVAVLLGLRATGATLGWGFQFQSPVFLALMAGLLFFLGLSLAGQFEIGLTLTSAGGALAQKQGYTGSFFTGVLAVVVATPCTAPFMERLSLRAESVRSGHLCCLHSARLGPGRAVRRAHSATSLDAPAPEARRMDGSVAPGRRHSDLRHGNLAGLGAGAGLWRQCALRAFGELPAACHRWLVPRPLPAKRWSFAVAALILLGVVALAFFGQRLVSESAGRTGQFGRSDLDSVAANGWEPWSPETVSRYQAQGRPVFVDFTASWCLSCQVNERIALNRPEVKQAFQSANVALLRADWTRHDEAITQALTTLAEAACLPTPSTLPARANRRCCRRC